MHHLLGPQDRVLLVYDRRLGRVGLYLNDCLKRGFGSRAAGAADYHQIVSSLRLKLRVYIVHRRSHSESRRVILGFRGSDY